MARDNTARERDSEQSLLDRRSYLKLAGAAAASVGVAGAASRSADAATYDTIKVPAGGRKVFKVGSGETFENKLIDITASGAHFRILTSGSGWTIRNIGVKGRNDDTSDTYSCINARAADGGHGRIENVYLGDGGGARTYHAAIGGYGNAGHVTIRNVHVQGWGADGVYLSQPGVPSNTDQRGTFTVDTVYAKNNNIENIRIGTTGSTIKNSVVHVEGRNAVQANESGQKNPRGIWLKEQSGLVVENCDIKVNGADAVLASSGGSGTVKNSRVDGSFRGPVTQQNVSGNPDVTPPSSVPMTAEEAASGQVSSSSDSTTSTGETQQDSDVQGKVLELVAGPDTANIEYEFTVDGAVQKRTDADDVAAEGNDSITDNGDGTVTVSGASGNGYGDSYVVDGDIVSMDLDESKWTIRYDGEEVSVQDIVKQNQGSVLELVAGPDTANVTYEFTVDGAVQKRTDADDVAAEGNDSITDNGDGTVTVTGLSGEGYGDSYLVEGDITAMDLDESKWTIRYDGEEVTVADLTDSSGGGTELPNILVIDGSDSPDAVSEYTFTVSGEVQKSAGLGSVNAHDTVTDGEISGVVGGGTDGYRFSGEITGFSLDGPAKVRVEDNA